MIELKQHKKFKQDISKVTFSDSQFNKYVKSYTPNTYQ